MVEPRVVRCELPGGSKNDKWQGAIQRAWIMSRHAPVAIFSSEKRGDVFDPALHDIVIHDGTLVVQAVLVSQGISVQAKAQQSSTYTGEPQTAEALPRGRGWYGFLRFLSAGLFSLSHDG